MVWSLGHRPSLDALRGIAVLLVLLRHFGLPGIPGAADVGVTLFFVLSGYLITALLLGELRDRGSVSLRDFYLRRAGRLLPALAVLIVAMGVWAVVADQVDVWRTSALAAGGYVVNWAWIADWPLPGLGHTWSLAVEEQFYLVWPAALLLLARSPRIATAVVGIIAVSFVLTIITMGPDYRLAHAGSHARAKDLLFGSLIAIGSIRLGRDVIMPSWAAAAAAATLAVLAIAVPAEFHAVFDGIPSAILVAWFAAHPRAADWRWLTGTGLISYGLYLYHFPLEAGQIPIFDGLDLWPRFIGLMVLSYTVAYASYRWIEQPVRRAVRRHAGWTRMTDGFSALSSSQAPGTGGMTSDGAAQSVGLGE